jgi:hypothetical protein
MGARGAAISLADRNRKGSRDRDQHTSGEESEEPTQSGTGIRYHAARAREARGSRREPLRDHGHQRQADREEDGPARQETGRHGRRLSGWIVRRVGARRRWFRMRSSILLPRGGREQGRDAVPLRGGDPR